jgi:hypothetical protein
VTAGTAFAHGLNNPDADSSDGGRMPAPYSHGESHIMKTKLDDAVEPSDEKAARSLATMVVSSARSFNQPSQLELIVDFLTDRDGLNLAYGSPPMTAERSHALVNNLIHRLYPGLVAGEEGGE